MKSAITKSDAEREILDRAEFARLIRKEDGLRVCVHVDLYSRRDVIKGIPDGFVARMTAKEAISKLNAGDFDAFVWQHSHYGAYVANAVAPAAVQLRRLAEITAMKISRHEERLATPQVNEEWDAESRARSETALAELRATSARIRAQLADLEAQPMSA